MNTTPATITRPSAILASIIRITATGLAVLVLLAAARAQETTAGSIKVGIIGLDAHAVPWTQIIHKPDAPAPISSMRIVAAYPAFSADIPFSADNIQKNTEKMRGFGVEISDSLNAMLRKVDAVMVLGIDGRPHLEHARAVFAAKKPVFIDKPVAASLAEIIEVYRQADESGTPCFSNSSLRYGAGVVALANDPKIGRVLGCDAYSNNKSILPGHPDLFYYGIHGCEILFTLMGPGCRSVSRVKAEAADLVTGVWNDGRIGTFRGILQGQVGFGATVFGEKGIGTVGKFEGYDALLVEIAKFFKTGKAPISVEHTLEIYAFLEAADESVRQGGRAVTIESILAKARKDAKALRKQ